MVGIYMVHITTLSSYTLGKVTRSEHYFTISSYILISIPVEVVLGTAVIICKT